MLYLAVKIWKKSVFFLRLNQLTSAIRFREFPSVPVGRVRDRLNQWEHAHRRVLGVRETRIAVPVCQSIVQSTKCMQPVGPASRIYASRRGTTSATGSLTRWPWVHCLPEWFHRTPADPRGGGNRRRRNVTVSSFRCCASLAANRERRFSFATRHWGGFIH